jgi:hypothetical protein
MRIEMKEKERLGKQARSRNSKILSIALSLMMPFLFINIAVADAGFAKNEHQTKVGVEQPAYRDSTTSSLLGVYIRNQMFGRHNCMDSELGDLTNPGFPPEPTRTDDTLDIGQILQEDISNYFIFQKEMHNRMITVSFVYVIEEKEKEYLREVIFRSYLCRQYFLF